MAINVKSIIADTVLKLCQEKSLSKVTIADIQEASGVSRQTFYNHFKDPDHFPMDVSFGQSDGLLRGHAVLPAQRCDLPCIYGAGLPNVWGQLPD